MSNVAIKFSHTGPSQGALPLAGRGRRIIIIIIIIIIIKHVIKKKKKKHNTHKKKKSPPPSLRPGSGPWVVGSIAVTRRSSERSGFARAWGFAPNVFFLMFFFLQKRKIYRVCLTCFFSTNIVS